MTKMLVKDPQGRKTATELLNHPFIQIGLTVKASEIESVVMKAKEANKRENDP